MSLVPTSFCRAALVAATIALAVSPADAARPVTHQFSGQLTTITNGSGGLLDLTGVFTMGQAVTLDCTIERDTAPVQQDPYTSAYTDAVLSLAFSIGAWSGSGAPAGSITTVSDNAQPPTRLLPQVQSAVYDQYSGSAQGGIVPPPLGTTQWQSLTYTFDDVQGTVFGSTAIPGVFPDLAEFEGKTATFLFFDFTQFKSGYVMATLSGVSSPARPSTWGGLKALYR